MLKKIATLISIIIIELTPLHANENISEIEITQSINLGISGVEDILKKVSIYKLFPENKTLLHYAVELDKYDVVSFLVNKDILLSQKGGEFYGTALQEAIYYGYPDIANFLIEQDTPPNIQDINGDTALHIAASNGDLDIITSLLSHGADKYIVNNNGKTAYDLIPDLTFDDTSEMKSLLATTSSTIQSKKNLHNNLSFNNIIKSLPTQHRNNRVIDTIDSSSSFKQSNIGININITNEN